MMIVILKLNFYYEYEPMANDNLIIAEYNSSKSCISKTDAKNHSHQNIYAA